MDFEGFKIRASYWLEHRIKYVGTFMSGTFTILVGFLLLFADYIVDLSPYVQEQSIFDRLANVTVILISVISGISLTTFSVIFVVMQLASSQFSPRILRHFLANDVRIQQFIRLVYRDIVPLYTATGGIGYYGRKAVPHHTRRRTVSCFALPCMELPANDYLPECQHECCRHCW